MLQTLRLVHKTILVDKARLDRLHTCLQLLLVIVIAVFLLAENLSPLSSLCMKVSIAAMGLVLQDDLIVAVHTSHDFDFVD